MRFLLCNFNSRAPRPIAELLSRPDVDYIEVRDRNAGCFDFRIERESVQTGKTSPMHES
jgi:hypothetical protein